MNQTLKTVGVTDAMRTNPAELLAVLLTQIPYVFNPEDLVLLKGLLEDKASPEKIRDETKTIIAPLFDRKVISLAPAPENGLVLAVHHLESAQKIVDFFHTEIIGPFFPSSGLVGLLAHLQATKPGLDMNLFKSNGLFLEPSEAEHVEDAKQPVAHRKPDLGQELYKFLKVQDPEGVESAWVSNKLLGCISVYAKHPLLNDFLKLHNATLEDLQALRGYTKASTTLRSGSRWMCHRFKVRL